MRDFGGHSLRSGFIPEGARRGITLPALMAMADHHSVASLEGCYQRARACDNPAALLADPVGDPSAGTP